MLNFFVLKTRVFSSYFEYSNNHGTTPNVCLFSKFWQVQLLKLIQRWSYLIGFVIPVDCNIKLKMQGIKAGKFKLKYSRAKCRQAIYDWRTRKILLIQKCCTATLELYSMHVKYVLKKNRNRHLSIFCNLFYFGKQPIYHTNLLPFDFLYIYRHIIYIYIFDYSKQVQDSEIMLYAIQK